MGSVRHAQKAQIDLLVAERIGDKLARVAVDTDLREELALTRVHITTPEEQKAFVAAQEAVERYLAESSAASPTELATMFGQADAALGNLVALNVAQADREADVSQRLDQLGDVVGVGAGFQGGESDRHERARRRRCRG